MNDFPLNACLHDLGARYPVSVPGMSQQKRSVTAHASTGQRKAARTSARTRPRTLSLAPQSAARDHHSPPCPRLRHPSAHVSTTEPRRNHAA
eukprot:353449-Rhodomonas_salina.7